MKRRRRIAFSSCRIFECAAVWVMGVRPQAGPSIFDPSKRSTRRGQGAGHVRTAKGLTWSRARARSGARPDIQRRSRSTVPPPPPVEILFSAPAEGEYDGDDGANSHALSRVSPGDAEGSHSGLLGRDSKARRGATAAIAFTTNYARENRALEIRPNRAARAGPAGGCRSRRGEGHRRRRDGAVYAHFTTGGREVLLRSDFTEQSGIRTLRSPSVR